MRSTAFLGGLATGLVSGLFAAICLAYLLGNSGGVFLMLPELPTLSSMLNQVYVNLRGALVPFLLVLVFYFIQVVSLRGLLQGETQPALELVLRREQLIDLAANLFFGIGEIISKLKLVKDDGYGLLMIDNELAGRQANTVPASGN